MAVHAAHDRQERFAAAGVACVLEAQLSLERRDEFIHLPARCAVDAGTCVKYSFERLDGERHLPACPGEVAVSHMVLPQYVIVAMDADFEAGIPDRSHRRALAAADVGAWQQRSITQRLPAVVPRDGGAHDLAEEAGAKDSLQRSPGMVRPQAEQKSRFDAVTIQELKQARDTFAGTP